MRAPTQSYASQSDHPTHPHSVDRSLRHSNRVEPSRVSASSESAPATACDCASCACRSQLFRLLSRCLLVCRLSLVELSFLLTALIAGVRLVRRRHTDSGHIVAPGGYRGGTPDLASGDGRAAGVEGVLRRQPADPLAALPSVTEKFDNLRSRLHDLALSNGGCQLPVRVK